MTVVEGFLACPIPGEEQAFATVATSTIPDREGPHAIQALQAVFTPMAIGCKQDFGITLRPKAFTLRLEFCE